jgi:hypothetical protein
MRENKIDSGKIDGKQTYKVSQLVNVSFARNGRWKGNEDGMEKKPKRSQLVNVSFARKGMENRTGNGTRERPDREKLISITYFVTLIYVLMYRN